jgi:hypothetical protein
LCDGSQSRFRCRGIACWSGWPTPSTFSTRPPGRIQGQQYGITRILFHNRGDILLTTVHDYTRQHGHHLVLLATDDHGQIAAVEASAPDLDTDPVTRILKVRDGDLTFHALPNTWSYRARGQHHTYTLTAGVGDQPMWTVTIDHSEPVAHDHLDDAVNTVLEHHAPPPLNHHPTGRAHITSWTRPLPSQQTGGSPCPTSISVTPGISSTPPMACPDNYGSHPTGPHPKTPGCSTAPANSSPSSPTAIRGTSPGRVSSRWRRVTSAIRDLMS